MTISVYPEYKESGVPWLGHVPEHWEAKRLKYVATLITRKSCLDEQAVALENIESWTARYLATDSEFEGDGVSFQSGDILFGKLRPYLAKAWLAEFNGTAVGDFHVLRLRNVFDGRFACYLLLSQGYISLIDGSTFGAKMPRVSWEFMGNTVIPLPPLEEQRTIASFLDRKTAQIDKLIAKKEALIKKLDEKRTAIITQAVTKGLDPSVPMKKSGVEWIGEIPKHWEVKQTRHIFKIYSGSTPKSGEELLWDGDIVWFTPDDLGNNEQKYISESRRKITDEGYKSCGTSLAKTNSIVLSTRAPIGHIALSTVPACCNQGCRILEPEKSSPEYWYYTMLSGIPILQSLGQGSTFMELPRQSLASFKLPYTPIKEQQAIAEHIEKSTATIDRQKAQVTEAIERLKEYRSALITDAVTGKMDVHSHRTKESLSA